MGLHADPRRAEERGAPRGAIDHFRHVITEFVEHLGTDSLERARSYMEDALRMTAHLIMSTPEYQIV